MKGRRVNKGSDIKGPIGWMARNVVAANLLMLLFLVGGGVMFTNITQEFFPDIATDTVSVQVAYPGASPDEVEEGIVLAVEEGMRGVEGVKEVTATASEGMARITAELLSNANSMKTYQDIQSEVDRIRTIPEDAEKPVVTLDVRRRMVLSLVLWGNAKEKSLKNLAENIREKLLQNKSITQVELSGVRPLEISIEVPSNNLRRYGLTLNQVASRLRSASLDLPAGALKTEAGEILVRVKERRDWGKEFAATPIITTPDGTEVLLRDIAKVTDGFEDVDYYAKYNGLPAVRIEVYRVGKETPIEVHSAVESVVDEIRPDLPIGTHIKIRMSFADIYRQRATLLLKNGAMGLGLVLLLLGSFLEIRLAFWVMLGIPVSFLGAILLMPVVGLSINMMTMFAFILTLGIVVDDAIVVGENIYHRRQQGEDFMTAAVAGAREVSMPVAFSILTNMVAFLPMLFLPGMMGKFLWMLPVVVITTFFISWIECVLILPAHLGHQKERKSWKIFATISERQQKLSKAFVSWIKEKYAPFLEVAIRHRYLVVAISIAILAVTIGYLKSGRMGFQLFSTIESDYAYGSCVLPYGSPIKTTSEVVKKMELAARRVAVEMGHPELIQGVFSELGKGGSCYASIRVYLADVKIREKLGIGTQEFVDAWRKEIGTVPGVVLMRLMADRGGPGSGPALTVELHHDNIETLQKAATDLSTELQKFPLVRDADSGYQEGKPQIDFVLKPEGKSLGLTALSVARQIRAAYEGDEVLRQQRGRDEIKVKVRLPERERVSEYDLDDFILQVPNGGEIPFNEAVSFRRGRAYTVINRRNGQRSMSVTSDVRPKSKTGQVMKVLDSETLPALMARYHGLSYSYEGRQADDRESFASLKTGLIMVLLGIYALLAIPFRSYSQPLIVMISIPFGVVGAIIGHLIMGYEFTLLGVIGMIALSGVVVNDALVLIDFANRRRLKGNSIHDAITAAGVQRFRPIMLTTLTTFGGLMPIIFETSRQARFLIPMAISLGYGLLFATMVTLLLVPCLYVVLDDIHTQIRKLFH